MTAAASGRSGMPPRSSAAGAAQSLQQPGALVRPGEARSQDGAGFSTPSESPTQLAIRRLKENRIAQVAMAVFLLVCIACFSAGWFEAHWAGRTAVEQNLSGTTQIDGKQVEAVDLRGMPRVGPGLRREYTFGTDALGRDVFIRALAGGSVSLRIGVGAALLSVIIGTVLGLTAGFYGGRVDTVLSRIVEILLAFPSTVFAIALSASIAASGKIGPFSSGSIMVPLLIIGVLGGPPFARIVRSKALELANAEFVEAARALGGDDQRIMVRHMLPHLMTTIITYFGLIVSSAIIAEAGLSFLGVGVQPPTPSWGGLIADGRIFYSTAWWISGAGGIMVMLTVLSLNLVGEAVEEAFDPKSGGR